MARRRSQTAPGQAVYLLHESLRVPSREGEKFRWLPAGTQANADELAGLVLPALETGGIIEQVSAASYACEACQEHGKAEDKKATYALEELQAHYREAHPGLAPPEEV